MPGSFALLRAFSSVACLKASMHSGFTRTCTWTINMARFSTEPTRNASLDWSSFALADRRGLWNVLLTYEKSPRDLLLGFDSGSGRHKFASADGPTTDAQNCSAAEQSNAGPGDARVQAGACAARDHSGHQQHRGSRPASARGRGKGEAGNAAEDNRISKETRGGRFALGPIRVGAALPLRRWPGKG